MEQQSRFWFWYTVSAGLIVVVIAVGWYFLAHKQALAPTDLNITDNATTTDTGAYIITPIEIETSGKTVAKVPLPSLERPYTPPADAPASIQAEDKVAVAAALAELKKNPDNITNWLQLALYRKNASDYAGAEEIWNYATKVWPSDTVAYNNLADLYQNYLHDYSKAILYWNKVISLKPSTISAYLNLTALYRINLKDTVKAKATLQAGLKANPNNSDLQHALSSY
ncbi:MAG: hypothetical protein Q7S26_00580 [bacterium]|nr:hypothetical protein [bacterium]